MIFLGDLIKIILRKLYFVVIFTIVGFGFGVGYFDVIVVPKYSATSTFLIDKQINVVVKEQAFSVVKSKDVSDMTLNELNPDIIDAYGGKETLRNLLSTNLVVGSPNTWSPEIVVSFWSENSQHTDEIVNTLVNSAVIFGNTNTDFFSGALSVDKIAETSTFIGVDRQTIYIFSTLIGTFLGLFVVYVIYLLSDKISSASDLMKHNISINKVSISSTKLEHDKKQIYDLQNEMDMTSQQNEVKIIGIITTNHFQRNIDILRNIYINYSALGKSVLLINFDEQLTESGHNGAISDDFHNGKVYKDIKSVFTFFAIDRGLELHYNKENILVAKTLKEVDLYNFLNNEKQKFDYVILNFLPSSLDSSYKFLLNKLDVLLINIYSHYSKKSDLDILLKEIKGSLRKKTIIALIDYEKKLKK